MKAHLSRDTPNSLPATGNNACRRQGLDVWESEGGRLESSARPDRESRARVARSAFKRSAPSNLAKVLAVSIILASLSACSREGSIFSGDDASSHNAVDSVVQPESDMRNRTHRSQENPRQIEETDTQKKGDITNDNSG